MICFVDVDMATHQNADVPRGGQLVADADWVPHVERIGKTCTAAYVTSIGGAFGRDPGRGREST